MPDVKHTHIGGQAVLEGVMMRGKHNWAVAVRKTDGSIYLEEHDLPHSAARDHAWLRWPVIRGVWGFYETIRLAMQAFTISAQQAGDEEAGESLSGGDHCGQRHQPPTCDLRARCRGRTHRHPVG